MNDLINKVGGVSNARKIVDVAPEGAKRWLNGIYLKQGKWTWWWSSHVNKWLQYEKHIYSNSKFDIATDLKDLRTAIADHDRTDHIANMDNHISPNTKVIER